MITCQGGWGQKPHQCLYFNYYDNFWRLGRLWVLIHSGVGGWGGFNHWGGGYGGTLGWVALRLEQLARCWNQLGLGGGSATGTLGLGGGLGCELLGRWLWLKIITL